jgi:uncharacterized protein with NAD-binding domain and iron-sulfur cluster
MADFVRLHPQAAQAKLVKYTIVRIPNSVYQARPGADAYRPDQATPVSNFFLAGDYTQQEFLASIEGATLSARRCVERVEQYIQARASTPNKTNTASVAVLAGS